MTKKLSTDQSKAASETLYRLDRLAASIQANHTAWGLPFEAARSIVNHLDRVADEFEQGVFGPESLQRRQAEILKSAKVLQRDSDEGYMDAFQVSHGVVQSDGDEPYMAAYRDDQSAAVQDGKASNGRPLAP